jgi:hypothetical protein
VTSIWGLAEMSEAPDGVEFLCRVPSRPARGPCRFKQRDVARAFKAAKAAGVEVARVDLAPDGTISVIPADRQNPQNRQIPSNNEWDDVLGKPTTPLHS